MLLSEGGMREGDEKRTAQLDGLGGASSLVLVLRSSCQSVVPTFSGSQLRLVAQLGFWLLCYTGVLKRWVAVAAVDWGEELAGCDSSVSTAGC